MATFTSEQITDLAEILGTNSDVLGDHLEYFESVISDSDKVRVLELVTEWQAVGTSGMVQSIEPNMRNFGVRRGAGASASSLARRIASLLQWEYSSGSRLVRA